MTLNLSTRLSIITKMQRIEMQVFKIVICDIYYSKLAEEILVTTINFLDIDIVIKFNFKEIPNFVHPQSVEKFKKFSAEAWPSLINRLRNGIVNANLYLKIAKIGHYFFQKHTNINEQKKLYNTNTDCRIILINE